MEAFIFETVQMVEDLEQVVLNSEKESSFSSDDINCIFRIMHTIKSSAAMMLFKNISSLAHSTEDLFYYIREKKPAYVDQSKLTDIVLEGIDYIKNEMDSIQAGQREDTDVSALLARVKSCLAELKEANDDGSTTAASTSSTATPAVQRYYISAEPTPVRKGKRYMVMIFFEADCEMENVRAFTVAHHLKDLAEDIEYYPPDIIADAASAEVIRKEGFQLLFSSERSMDELREFFMQTAFLSRLELEEYEVEPVEEQPEAKGPPRQIVLDDGPEPAVSIPEKVERTPPPATSKQSIISVNVAKLDKLMDLVGELVITQAMVTQNPELTALLPDSFYKSARQLQKITDELQDTVMSIRMVPLGPTFHKMNRIVRDAGKTLAKDVALSIVGEETEVDKNIIEHISDPLMHLIRNSLDHGIEPASERKAAGKPEQGTILLEAKNSGGDVWIIVKDDGRGLDRAKILQKARANGLTTKQDNELTDKEIYSFIFLPGFSTKDAVTELSGRGVGMDVVTKNIEKIGGIIQIDSRHGEGTTISIKIPLTLAIIDGMNIRVGQSRYTIPTTAIRQSFRARADDIIRDPHGNEMLIIRGECYPIIRLHSIYKIKTEVTKLEEGISILVDNNGTGACVFADELLGQQQVVVKALPRYIKKIKGLAGCTLLGDGNISLILDIGGVTSYYA